MKILLVGVDQVPHLGRSFRLALDQLGHNVTLVDERRAFTLLDRRPIRPLVWMLLGKKPAGYWMFNNELLRMVVYFKPEIVLVIKGSYVSPAMLQNIRQRTGAVLVNYSTDHPFNPIVSTKFIRDSLPLWDVYATPRRATIPQLQAQCRGRVMYMPFGYDPTLHYPEPNISPNETAQWSSDVTFLGGCDRDRVPFLDPLASDETLNVSLYGGYYNYTPALKRRHRGLVYGRAYRLVLSTTKIALCLVRQANQDGHVMRTFEIPACGAFMLAERTDEHQELFVEDQEASFFSSPEEMLDKAKYYVTHRAERERIARAGYKRVTNGSTRYLDRLQNLLEQVLR